MQERRTSVRITHRCRAKYCSTDEFLPKDGHLANLGQHGAGLLVREPHRAGERLTVSFTIPGEKVPVTTTGTVRWTNGPTRPGDWHPLGMEWLPAEEATTQRLQRFLSRSTAIPAFRRPHAKSPQASLSRRRQAWWLAVGGLLLVGLGVWWVLILHYDNRHLQEVLIQRNAAIQAFRLQDQKLRNQLELTKAHLTVTAQEVQRLDEQAADLEHETRLLSQEVLKFQSSYSHIYQERDALIHRILELEQERAAIMGATVPVEELQRAIREAIERREDDPAYRLSPRFELPLEPIIGNRGYLIREGRPTTRPTRGPMRVRVLDPTPAN